jgi:hypothetical protein
VGINLAALGAVLGDGENVLRGLNPFHCEAGLPTSACFILRRDDPPREGPSFGILQAAQEQAGISPLGAAQGIPVEAFATVLPSADWGIARLNVGAALEPIRGRMAGFVQNDEEGWGPYRAAHAMITGHQVFTDKDRRDLQRHLAKIAAQSVLTNPAPKT